MGAKLHHLSNTFIVNHLVFDSVDWRFSMVSPLWVIRLHVCSRGVVCLLSKGKKTLVSSVASVAEMLVNDSLKETSFGLHHLLMARDLCLWVSLLLVVTPLAFQWIGQWPMTCWFWTKRRWTLKQTSKYSNRQVNNKQTKQANTQNRQVKEHSITQQFLDNYSMYLGDRDRIVVIDNVAGLFPIIVCSIYNLVASYFCYQLRVTSSSRLRVTSRSRLWVTSRSRLWVTSSSRL